MRKGAGVNLTHSGQPASASAEYVAETTSLSNSSVELIMPLFRLTVVNKTSVIRKWGLENRTLIRRHLLSSQSSQDENIKHAFHKMHHRCRVVVTGIGTITPLGYDMQSTWKSVLQTNDKDSKSNGITTLYSALLEQSLSSEQFDKEWEQLQALSCQMAASVPNEWIINHPQYVNTSPPSWLDGRTSRFVQLGMWRLQTNACLLRGFTHISFSFLQLSALIAAQEAIQNSGLNDWLNPNDTHEMSQSSLELLENRRYDFGVSVGNGMSSTREISSVSTSKSLRRLSPHFIPQILPNSPAARIAIHHQLHGPNLSHSEACAAGAAAIAQSVELIQSGKVKGMVAGGCESAVEALGLAGFSRLRALSTSDHSTTDAYQSEEDKIKTVQSSSRPFDKKRNGFVLAEGAAMLVLEEYEHAIERGANILAEIKGVGYSGDGHHITAPEPTGKGAAKAMVNAVEDAGCSMNDVDYINTHATSTPLGDVAEINAIRLALKPDKEQYPPLLVSSTKGACGHMLGAAGAIEAALTCLSVSNDIVPHTRNLEEVSEDITKAMKPSLPTATGQVPKHQRTIHLVQHAPIPQKVNTAISNSFAFGGTNVSLVFGKT